MIPRSGDGIRLIDWLVSSRLDQSRKRSFNR
jgi:uncharacterized protein (DUF58 family)